MCPKGAVHVPYRGAVRVCKRLEVDYAEAVVDFEFGHRMAVPVIQGVVIAEEYYDQVMEQLAKDEAERTRKEDEKRRKKALEMWRKLLMGMRIAERIRQEYGEIGEGVEVFGHFRDNFDGKAGEPPDDGKPTRGDADMAGGFLPEGYDEERDDDKEAGRTSSFFPVVDDEDEDEGSLLVQDDRLAGGSNIGTVAATASADEESAPEAGSDVHTTQRPPEGRRIATRSSSRRRARHRD